MLNPIFVFLLLFVGIPATELYLMIEVGDRIGAASTVLLVLLTALIGGLLVRMQGLAVLLRVREMLDRAEVPAGPMLEGVLLLIAGALLLLPGFVTDTLGFLLLIPPVRHRLVLYWLESRRGTSQVPPHHGGPSGPPGQRVIDGEYKREN